MPAVNTLVDAVPAREELFVQPPFVSGGANILNAAGKIQNAGGTLADATGLVSSSVAPILVNQTALNLSVNTSGTALTTVNSVGFTLTRPANIWTFVTGSISRTDANAGTFQCSYGMQMDGLYASAFGSNPSLWGDVQNALFAAALNNGALIVPVTFMTVWLSVPAGGHSLAVVCQSSGASGVFNVTGNPAVLSLGS